jgi:hypothetical protein
MLEFRRPHSPEVDSEVGLDPYHPARGLYPAGVLPDSQASHRFLKLPDGAIVDLSRREIRRQTTVRLTALEAQLLCYLADRPD